LLEEHVTVGVPGFLVAIKQLKSTEQSAIEELTREAAFMAQLNHDNIVKLHGVVTVSFALFLYLKHPMLFSL
jgi:serine/threonine protein kinase